MSDLKNKKIEKDTILINKMCTGSFTINNIGHEIINYFKDDNGDNYIYILPYGGMDKKYNDRIDKIILTGSLSKKRVAIQAIIEIEKEGQIHKDGDRGNIEVHKKQLDALKNVTYGGATLNQIFQYNKGNDEAIYVTFKAKEILKPKDNIEIYLSNNPEDSNNEKNIIKVNKNLPSSSLKGYFIKNEKYKINNKEYSIYNDFDNIRDFINKNKNELFEVMDTPRINKEKIDNFKLENDNINYLQLIEKEDEEQIYTNLIYYWLNCNNLIDKFINERLSLSDSFELKKEKRIKHGRMDIFAISDKKAAVIIENKIQSGLNGVDKIEETTQLGKYVKDINEEYKIDKEKIYGMIFVPNYNMNSLKKEIRELEKEYILKKYILIPYSDLFEFFNKSETKEILKNDLYYKGYYEDFLRCLKNHIYNNINEKNKNEMERKFIYAIKRALSNH